MRVPFWIKNRVGSFDLLPSYFKEVRLHFLDVIWGIGVGAGVPYMIWGTYSLFKTPPQTVNWVAITGAVFLAGYYLWRADHMRTLRRITLGDVRAIITPTRNQVTGQPGADQVYVQIGIQCASDIGVDGCSGKLLSVEKWNADANDWQPTALDEPLDLVWSVLDTEKCSLEPSAPRRLNLFYVEDVPHKWIRIATKRMPFRMEEVFSRASAEDVFKFNIAVTGDACPTVKQTLRVQLGYQFGNPVVGPVADQN